MHGPNFLGNFQMLSPIPATPKKEGRVKTSQIIAVRRDDASPLRVLQKNMQEINRKAICSVRRLARCCYAPITVM